jgi:glucan-binding YG repeat protein
MKKRLLVPIICLAMVAMFLQALPKGVSATENPTGTGLAEFAIKAYQDGWGYVYGTYGQVITQAIIDGKAQQYPGNYDGILSDGRTVYQVAQKWIGHRAADCVGLMKAYLWWRGDSLAPGYNSAQDRSANGTFNAATVKGPISTLPETHGICLWKDGHVGIYIGNGWVIEARGTDYGVVMTRLSDRPWTNWFQNPYVSYAANGWTSFNGQACYYVNGCYVTGLQVIDAKTYLFGSDGFQQTGFALVDGQVRYFKADGSSLTGWQTIDGARYYLSAGNVASTGWTEIDGQLHLFSDLGLLLAGWQQTAEGIYFLDSNGVALTGTQTIDGRVYDFATNGRLRTGWQDEDGTKSYRDLSSHLLTGLQMIGGQTYQFDPDGVMLTGLQAVYTGKRFFDPGTGASLTGVQTLDGQAVLLNGEGILVETAGLSFLNGKVYRTGS